MTTAKHLAASGHRPRRPRRVALAILGALAALAVGVAVAAVLFDVRAPLGGSGSVDPAEAVAASATVRYTDGYCQAANPQGTPATALDLSGPRGGTCTVYFAVANPNPADMNLVVQGVDLGSTVPPDVLTATLSTKQHSAMTAPPDACGDPIGTGNPAAYVAVKFTISPTVPSSGATFTLGPDAALRFVDAAGYDAAACKEVAQ